jgi:competence protein ComEA
MTGRPVSSNEQSVGETSEAKREEFMKKLLLALAMWFAISGVALAVVNINTATKEELTSLKGVGEKRAQEIINYRTKNGPFKTVDDLEKVPGIGPGIMKQIRSEVTTSGKTNIEKAATKDAKAADAKKVEPAKGTAAKPDDKKVEKK